MTDYISPVFFFFVFFFLSFFFPHLQLQLRVFRASLLDFSTALKLLRTLRILSDHPHEYHTPQNHIETSPSIQFTSQGLLSSPVSSILILCPTLPTLPVHHRWYTPCQSHAEATLLAQPLPSPRPQVAARAAPIQPQTLAPANTSRTMSRSGPQKNEKSIDTSMPHCPSTKPAAVCRVSNGTTRGPMTQNGDRAALPPRI